MLPRAVQMVSWSASPTMIRPCVMGAVSAAYVLLVPGHVSAAQRGLLKGEGLH